MKLRLFLFFAFAGMAIGLSSLRVSGATEQTCETQQEAEDKQVWIELAMWYAEKNVDLLRKLVSWDSDLSEDKRAQGNALLEAFAGEYLPNYSAQYKVARLAALDKQKTFCTLMDALLREKVELPKSKAFQNFIGLYYDATREYFNLRNELVDLYSQHKAGIMSSDDLASVDGKFASSSRK